MNKDLLVHFRENRQYRELIKSALDHRPVVAEWKPQETRDSSEKLIEDIKHASAQRQGFDLLYTLLLGERPNG